MGVLVDTLESRLPCKFEEFANRLTRELPNIGVRAYSCSVGPGSGYNGHSLFVDCIIIDAHKEPDSVALGVQIAYLTTRPRINADVVWGHPSEYVEATFFEDWQSPEDWPEVSDELLEKRYADIPRLMSALSEAIRRRHPPA